VAQKIERRRRDRPDDLAVPRELVVRAGADEARGRLERDQVCEGAGVGLVALGERAEDRVAAMPGGLAAIAAGALVLGTLWPAALVAAFVLMGLGLGCASVASTSLGTAALPDDQQGIASGVLNAAAQVGTAMGLAAIVPLGYRAGLAAVAALALGAATRSWRPSRRRPTTLHR
jgi:MFS family permease